MNLFIIENGFDIKKFENELKNKEKRLIFTIDYESHKLLEHKGISHIIGEEILDSKDYDLIDNITIETTKNLFLKYEQKLIFESIFLPKLIEHEFYQYLLIQFMKPLVILRIIKKYAKENDIVYNFTIYDNFIKSIHEKKDSIRYENFDTQVTNVLYHDKIKFSISIFKKRLHITISRKTFSYIKHLQNLLTEKIFNFEPDYNNSKKNILLINFDPIEYEELLLQLKNSKNNFILLNTRKPVITNLKSLKIIRNSKIKISNLDKFISNQLFDKQVDEFEINLNHIFKDIQYFRNIFSIEGKSFWDSIDTTFKNMIYERFKESVIRILSLKLYFKNISINKIIVWVDVGQEEKECIMVGKQFKIESLMLQHGRFQTSKKWDKFAQFLGQFPAPLLSDKQIVWGDVTKRYAISHSHMSQNIIIGGSPRHDKFFNKIPSTKKNNTVVLATTGTMFLSSDSCTTQSQIKYDNFIIEVCRVVRSLKNFKLIVKPHPSQILTQYVRNIIREIDPNILITEEQKNESLFQFANLVITFNNSTTALEALILNTPVISLQTEDWANEDDVAQSNAIKCVSDLSECESQIKDILTEIYSEKSLIENRQKFLFDYFKNPGTASKFIANYLKNNE